MCIRDSPKCRPEEKMLGVHKELLNRIVRRRSVTRQLLGMRHRLAHRVACRRRDEVILFREIVFLGTARDAGTRCDAAGTEARVAVLDQDLEGRGQNRGLGLAAPFGLRASRLWGCARHDHPWAASSLPFRRPKTNTGRAYFSSFALPLPFVSGGRPNLLLVRKRSGRTRPASPRLPRQAASSFSDWVKTRPPLSTQVNPSAAVKVFRSESSPSL